jgi:hypothetical protein
VAATATSANAPQLAIPPVALAKTADRTFISTAPVTHSLPTAPAKHTPVTPAMPEAPAVPALPAPVVPEHSDHASSSSANAFGGNLAVLSAAPAMAASLDRRTRVAANCRSSQCTASLIAWPG